MLTRPVTYRGFEFNTVTVDPDANVGCKLDTFDFSDVDVVQFTEKRSQQDGVDVGQPFLGSRRVRFSGTLYDLSHPALYDRMWLARAAMSPTLADREDPDEHGYQPLLFSVPTARIADYPSEVIDLRMLAMPRAFSIPIQDSMVGGDDDTPLALPFQGSFVCKNPSITAATATDVPFTPTDDVTDVGNNRGTYHVPFNALFVVSAAAGTILGSVNGQSFLITVPASSGTRVIRYDGTEKELTSTEGDIRQDRASWLSWPTATNWPLIPSGTFPYSVTFGGSLALVGDPGDSHLWFWEAYA